MDETFPKRPTPTVVEGVVQFQIPIDPADYGNLQQLYLDQLNLPKNQLASQWTEYSANRFWEMPQVRMLPRLPRRYEPIDVPHKLIDIDIMSFLNTALRLKLINKTEQKALREEWTIRPKISISPNIGFYQEVENHAIRSNFWGIHYIDYHLVFLDRALERQLIDETKRDHIASALLDLSTGELSIEDVRKKFDEAAENKQLYALIETALKSVYVFVKGESINVNDKESTQAEMNRLRTKDLFLAPGFDITPLTEIRLIGIDELASYNKPEILVEALMAINSHGGELGKGNVIRTHSLFPGEKAVLTMESYSKEASSYSLTSSVLDTTSTAAEESLARDVGVSTSWNKELTRSSSFSVGVEAKASWGWGSASGSVNSTSSAMDVSKQAFSNVEKATRSQANKVSNNRSIKIDTTSTRSSETSLRESVVRTIENINVSKPLNFIFRQLTQEILALYTVKEIRVVIRPSVNVDGKLGLLQDVPDVMRRELFKPGTDDKMIKKYYDQVVEAAKGLGGTDLLKDAPRFLVEYSSKDTIPRFEVNKQLRDRKINNKSMVSIDKSLKMPSGTISDKDEVSFDGYLVDISKYTIKAEGVYVDCQLSDTEGLDDYSKKLQQETNNAKSLQNKVAEETISILKMAKDLVNAAPSQQEKQAAFEKLVIPILNSINHKPNHE